MKTWKILKTGKGIVAYVNVNENDNRDTSYYALQLARKYFNDNSISGTQRLAEGEEKNGNIPTLELYYPERFTVDGIDYILKGGTFHPFLISFDYNKKSYLFAFSCYK